jgi:flavin reductase (DIM6/NTAB) family NADH-FMN oxidoreductase RutF
MQKSIEPTILCFGTPVAIISTLNADGSPNLAPMSSVWWLGWSCMLDLGSMGQTSDNLARTREWVINLPSADLVSGVDRLALTTGKDPVPERKQRRGYHCERDKFGTARWTPMSAETVGPPRIRECPVQMEGVVHDHCPFGNNTAATAFEVHITRLHVEESLLMPGTDTARPHIDPTRWRPLIMSFCRFFGTGEELQPSRLAQTDFMTTFGWRKAPAASAVGPGRGSGWAVINARLAEPSPYENTERHGDNDDSRDEQTCRSLYRGTTCRALHRRGWHASPTFVA